MDSDRAIAVLAQLAGGVFAGRDVVRQEVHPCLQVKFGEPGLYFTRVMFQVSVLWLVDIFLARRHFLTNFDLTSEIWRGMGAASLPRDDIM